MDDSKWTTRRGERVPYRESDSFDEGYRRMNRLQVERIHYEHYPDEEFGDDFDPSYKEEYETSRAGQENHFGKGPKGYQRSVARIKDDACEILARDFELDASGITVDLEERVLVLRGEVASRRDKRRAEWLLEELPGIDDIKNLISIKKSSVEGWIPGLGSIEDEV